MEKFPVVFDLDGTLVDTRGDLAAACNAVLGDAGHPSLSVEVISGFVGDGARALLRRAFAAHSVELSDQSADVQVEAFLKHALADPVRHSLLLPGVADAIERLSDRPLAVCTNKPRRLTLPVLEGMGLLDSFQVIVAGGDCPTRKPAPEMLLEVSRRLGRRAEELVMVGDGPQDILAAHAVGARAVGVQGGLLPLERLLEARPEVVLENLGELPEYLARTGRGGDE